MFKIALKLVFVLLSSVEICYGLGDAQPEAKKITIGILMPIEHAAIREIVAGFTEKVHEQYPQVVFNEQGAQGDIKLQRNILELFVGQGVDLVVPIGTSATQMALAVVKHQPIVSLAGIYAESERQKRIPLNITGVLDEIGGKNKLDFIREILPGIKNVSLIFHSGNEKNHQEVAEIIAYGKKIDIRIEIKSIQTFSELKAATESISNDSQAILILKDHLLASGIRMLVSIAAERAIPLITSDEGTVQIGATIALGVSERMIGEEGGRLAIKVLQGHSMEKLPMLDIQELAVFYNKEACRQKHIDLTKIQAYAAKHKYRLNPVSGT